MPVEGLSDRAESRRGGVIATSSQDPILSRAATAIPCTLIYKRFILFLYVGTLLEELSRSSPGAQSVSVIVACITTHLPGARTEGWVWGCGGGGGGSSNPRFPRPSGNPRFSDPPRDIPDKRYFLTCPRVPGIFTRAPLNLARGDPVSQGRKILPSWTRG